MRIAMFNGYGAVAPSQNAAVEETIRAQVQVMQQVQSALYSAFTKWKIGQTSRGVAYTVLFPPAMLIQLAKYDYSAAVSKWQASVDTWWATRMTDTVRGDPFAVGQDGQTRIAAWTAMGQRIVTWAKDIGQNMADDNFVADMKLLGDSFVYVVKKALDQGLKLPLKILPDWVPWAIGGAVALAVLFRFGPRR